MKNIKLPFLLFFTAGCISIIFQVIWQRELLFIFGGTIWSIAILLSAWMGGLALGSWLVRLFADRISNFLFTFCLTQIILILFSLIMFPIFKGINLLDYTLFALLQHNQILSLTLRSLIMFCVLLIPTSLIGAGLPLLSGSVPRDRIATLYSINALGSAAAAFVTGFILIALLGTTITMMITALVGTTLFLTGITFIKREAIDSKSGSVSVNILPEASWNTGFQKPARLLIPLIFMISGFTSLSYELLYNRILIYFTGNNTHCFTIIITIFILGLAFGSWLYGRLRHKIGPAHYRILIFGLLELLIGGWHLFFPDISLYVNQLAVTIKEALAFHQFTAVYTTRVVSSILLIGPPVIAYGFLFPLVIDLYNQLQKGRPEKQISLLYAANTAGSVAGPLITGFILISLFEVSGSLRFLSGINLLLALLLFGMLFFTQSTARNKLTYISAPLITLFLIACLVLIPSRLTIGQMAAKTYSSDKLLYYKEGVFGTVSVAKQWNKELHLKINGVGEVPTDYNSIRTFRLLAYLPFMAHQKAQSVLTIAFGGGITFGGVCQVDGPELVKNVEICGDVIEAARHYSHWNHNVLDSHEEKIITGDGRRYVEKTGERYDIIISDSTHPASSDSWVLYTRDFYDHCRKKLTDGGIMAQWIPIHKLDLYDYRIILSTFSAVFPNTELYICNEYTIILGSERPLLLSETAYNKLMNQSVIADDLRSVHFDTFLSVARCRIFNTKEMTSFVSDAPVATDNHSPLQYAETRSLGKDTQTELFEAFSDFVSDQTPDSASRYMIETINLNKLTLQGRHIEKLLHLNENIAMYHQEGIYDSEIEYQLNSAVDRVLYTFKKPDEIVKYRNDPTPEKIALIEKLCAIVPDDHNLNLLRGIMYSKVDRQSEALEIFLQQHRKMADPSTFQNIIMLLRRMNRHLEADRYLVNARLKYGQKWGKGLEQ